MRSERLKKHNCFRLSMVEMGLNSFRTGLRTIVHAFIHLFVHAYGFWMGRVGLRRTMSFTFRSTDTMESTCAMYVYGWHRKLGITLIRHEFNAFLF